MLNRRQSSRQIPKFAERVRSKLSVFTANFVTSVFGVAIGYSIFWGAFQSLLVGHVYSNDGRFVAVASNPVAQPAPKALKTGTDDEDKSDSEIGDALEIWYGRGLHHSLIAPCRMDFTFTGVNITNYKFGSDRRSNPHQARHLDVKGFAKDPLLPGPYIYMRFVTPLGASPVHRMAFDFTADGNGAYSGLNNGTEYFNAASNLILSPWECISTIFIGGGFEIVDFSDFKFEPVQTPTDAAPAPVR